MARETPSNAQICSWFDSLSNWGRWGADDLLGTLNLITDQKRAEAARLVREGISVSCALPIRFGEHNLDDAWPEPRRFMHILPSVHELDQDFVGRAPSADSVLLNCHGLTLTHLDAPAHHFFRPGPGRPMAGYNGLSPSEVTAREGVIRGDVTIASAGIASRGVLLDLPRLFGVDWLEPRTKIYPEDLEAAEAAQGILVGPGDVLCVRTGHPSRKRRMGWNSDPSIQAGPDGACLPWLRERDVAMLACDTANDVFPPDKGSLERPVHSIGMTAIGLWLLDGADYEELAANCERLARWEFLFVVPPLRLNGCTASPVNPIAML